MPVAGVLTVANVGDDQHLGHFALDGANGLLGNAIGCICARGQLVFFFRDTEQNHAAEAKAATLFALAHKIINGQLCVPGHGADVLPDSFPRNYEQRQNELRGRELRFADQTPDRFRRTQPAGPMYRKRHVCLLLSMKVAKRWFISGNVQGVGFRFFAQNKARELGLSGWTRNLDDGRVEVYAVGPQKALSDLAAALHSGPRMADVRHVEEREEAVQTLSGFSVR
jgi:acylphosphatase